MIHVNRSGTSLGTFSEEDVRAGLRAGRFLPTDLGWREGMSQWQPLSQFTEFAADIPAAAPSPPPPAGAPPTPGLPPATGAGTAPPLQTLEPRSGLPWEHRDTRGFLQAFADTLSMVLTKPALAFTVMRTEGDFGGPLLYAIIGGAIGAVVAFLLGLMVHSFGLIRPRHDAMGAMFGMTASGFGFVGQLIAIAIAPFIWGGLVHLALMLLGGAKKTFETTFRVIAFSQGSTAVLQLIPCCGGLIALVWNIVASSIGIARAHETDTGRATFAVLLPLVVCCGGITLILFAFFGGVAALSNHDWGH